MKNLLGRPASPCVGAIAFPKPPTPCIIPGCIPGTGRPKYQINQRF